MSKAVFALANILFKYFYPVYRVVYYIFKRKQDAYEIELLKRFIKSGDVVVDIGANVGFYTEIISGLVGEKGEVHSFEPEPVNFRHLAHSCKGKANVFVNNMAVSNEPGELKLFTSNLLNVDHRTYPVDDYANSFTVKSETLDNYLKGKKVDFIKMDIQGAEYFALLGMSKTLKDNPELKMLTEFWPFALKESGCQIDMFQNFLEDQKFFFYIVLDDDLVRIHDFKAYENEPKIKYFNLLLSRNEI